MSTFHGLQFQGPYFLWGPSWICDVYFNHGDIWWVAKFRVLVAKIETSKRITRTFETWLHQNLVPISRKVMRKPRHPTRKSTNFSPKWVLFPNFIIFLRHIFHMFPLFPWFFHSFPDFGSLPPPTRPWESSRIWAIRGARHVPHTSWPRQVSGVSVSTRRWGRTWRTLVFVYQGSLETAKLHLRIQGF